MLNDMVATPEIGFFVTHMMPRRRGAPGQFFEYMNSSLLGTDSGYVLTWHPGEGFARLAVSESGVPNGIAISSDGATVFVNYSAKGEICRIDRRRNVPTSRMVTDARAYSTCSGFWKIYHRRRSGIRCCALTRTYSNPL